MYDKNDYLPLSFSSLKAFSRSPLAFLDYKLGPRKETAAMNFGTLVHRAILEPEKYEQTTLIWDGRRAGDIEVPVIGGNARRSYHPPALYPAPAPYSAHDCEIYSAKG